MPTPIPPAAVNEDGIVCNGRGRMWAGERAQSVGYSVTKSFGCRNLRTTKFFCFLFTISLIRFYSPVIKIFLEPVEK